MNDQTSEDLPSTEELCEKIEQLMKAEHLSEEDKREFTRKALQIIRGDVEKEAV